MAPSTSTTSAAYRDAIDVFIEAACDNRAYAGNPSKLAVPIGGMLISLSILLYQPFINYSSGYRREPAWASRTVDEELGQPRPNLWKRRDEVEVSVYATPITDLGSKLISFTLSNHSIQLVLFAGATMGMIQAPPTSTSAEPIVSTRTLAHTRAIASASGQHRTYDLLIVQILSLTYLCRVNHRRL